MRLSSMLFLPAQERKTDYLGSRATSCGSVRQPESAPAPPASRSEVAAFHRDHAKVLGPFAVSEVDEWREKDCGKNSLSRWLIL